MSVVGRFREQRVVSLRQTARRLQEEVFVRLMNLLSLRGENSEENWIWQSRKLPWSWIRLKRKSNSCSWMLIENSSLELWLNFHRSRDFLPFCSLTRETIQHKLSTTGNSLIHRPRFPHSPLTFEGKSYGSDKARNFIIEIARRKIDATFNRAIVWLPAHSPSSQLLFFSL